VDRVPFTGIVPVLAFCLLTIPQSLTGMLTIPKEITPFQMDPGIPNYPLLGHSSRKARCGDSYHIAGKGAAAMEPAVPRFGFAGKKSGYGRGGGGRDPHHVLQRQRRWRALAFGE
jgi:hypothetical protein